MGNGAPLASCRKRRSPEYTTGNALIAAGDGVTGEDADAMLAPIALCATTLNVYAVPLFNPLTSALVALAPTLAEPPAGLDVTE